MATQKEKDRLLQEIRLSRESPVHRADLVPVSTEARVEELQASGSYRRGQLRGECRFSHLIRLNCNVQKHKVLAKGRFSGTWPVGCFSKSLVVDLAPGLKPTGSS